MRAVSVGAYCLQACDVFRGRARVGEGHPAQRPDPRPVARVHPPVGRDDARVVPRLGQRDRRVDGLLAHVVGVDDHVLVHHPLGQVGAEVGEAARVAVRRRRIGGERARGHAEPGPAARRWWSWTARRTRSWLSARGPGAGLRAPERAGAELVAAVDEHADGAAVEAHAGQRVVELVQEQRSSARRGRRTRRARCRPGPGRSVGWSAAAAAEELGDLDLEDDRHLALVDDAPGLERVGDDLEEALAGPPAWAST